jgi:hypothetical protein
MALKRLNVTSADSTYYQAHTTAIPPTNPAIMMAPDTNPPEPQVGTSAIPAFSVELASELTAPLSASLWEALAATLEMAAGLEVALALALADPLADEGEEVALLPPIPGLSSKETSLARSPHRASRAGRQLVETFERDTNLRRRVGYRSNKSSYPSVTYQYTDKEAHS